MKCLIIAAGKGNRLSRTGIPKPLLPLPGLRLIERTVLTAQQAGAEEFYIVTGYQAQQVESFLAQLAQRRRLKVQFIRNDEWEHKENGVSILKAKNYIKEDFVLLMSDHIFEESTLKDLIKESRHQDRVVLAADFKIEKNTLIDLNDVTKVQVQDGKIQNIRKTLKRYNAFDTGMFYCTPEIFTAIEESTRNGDTSLSGGVKVMASRGKAGVYDIGKRIWMDIDTPLDWKKARKLLYSNLTKPEDGWISRKINRKISTRLFTPLILRLFKRITPNIVTLISAGTGILAGIGFILHLPVIGAIVAQTASILDGSDGEIARLKKMQSAFGKFFDALLDRYSDSFIFFGMFLFALSSPETTALLGRIAAPLIYGIFGLALAGNLMVSYTSAKSVADLKYRYRGKVIAAGRGRDIRLFIVFLGGVLSVIHPLTVLAALAVIAVLTNAIVLLRVILSWRFELKKTNLIRKEVRAIIFDFDGTLADTMSFLTDLATRLLVEHYDLHEEEARDQYLRTSGLDFAAQMELIFPKHPQNGQVVADFEKKKRETVLEHPLFPAAIPTLKFFQGLGISRFVCSSTPEELLDRYWRSSPVVIPADGYYGMKQDQNKSSRIGSILKDQDLQPREVIFVGDSLKDGEIAVSKGIQFIGINRIFTEAEFREQGLCSVSDLTALVRLWRESMSFRKALEELKS